VEVIVLHVNQSFIVFDKVLEVDISEDKLGRLHSKSPGGVERIQVDQDMPSVSVDTACRNLRVGAVLAVVPPKEVIIIQSVELSLASGR